MAFILDGRGVRDKQHKNLKARFSKFGKRPTLAIITVGESESSRVYIREKERFGKSLGVEVRVINLPETTAEGRVIEKITVLNKDPGVSGVIVQLPLPEALGRLKVTEAIDPSKDADALSSYHLRRLWENEAGVLMPATPRGIIELLESYKVPVAGKKVVIVGRSSLVGKPLAISLLNRDATVAICHRLTPDLAKETRLADVLIVAAGSPKLIGEGYVREGQVVIDVGLGRLQEEDVGGSESRLVGDVDFEAVKERVAAITPVPGGVGPMTVLALFENLYDLLVQESDSMV